MNTSPGAWARGGPGARYFFYSSGLGSSSISLKDFPGDFLWCYRASRGGASFMFSPHLARFLLEIRQVFFLVAVLLLEPGVRS